MIHEVVVIPCALSTGRILVDSCRDSYGHVIFRPFMGITNRTTNLTPAVEMTLDEQFGESFRSCLVKLEHYTTTYTPTHRFLFVYLAILSHEQMPIRTTTVWKTICTLCNTDNISHRMHPVLRRLLNGSHRRVLSRDQ